jgi:hypothetical protein
MGGLFRPTVRGIDSVLLLALRVVILDGTLLAFPLSVSPKSSLDLPLFLLPIPRTRVVVLLGHQRNI